MKIGCFEYLCASSARQRMAAADPSLTPEQSKMPSMPATGADFVMVSIGTSLRNCAFGFLAPFLWFFHAMRASTCFSSLLAPAYAKKYGVDESEQRESRGRRHAGEGAVVRRVRPGEA